jgi:putative membrane protein insertion efficiency factor
MSKINYKIENLFRAIGLLLIKTYQVVLSPFLGGACRFEPSCSKYAADAFTTLRFFPALFLILKRLSKCHPWGASGYDPVHGCSLHFHPERSFDS